MPPFGPMRVHCSGRYGACPAVREWPADQVGWSARVVTLGQEGQLAAEGWTVVNSGTRSRRLCPACTQSAAALRPAPPAARSLARPRMSARRRAWALGMACSAGSTAAAVPAVAWHPVFWVAAGVLYVVAAACLLSVCP